MQHSWHIQTNSHQIISHRTIVPLCTCTDQVSKAGGLACTSETFTVSDHLKCGLPHGVLPLAIVENITVCITHAKLYTFLHCTCPCSTPFFPPQRDTSGLHNSVYSAHQVLCWRPHPAALWCPPHLPPVLHPDQRLCHRPVPGEGEREKGETQVSVQGRWRGGEL